MEIENKQGRRFFDASTDAEIEFSQIKPETRIYYREPSHCGFCAPDVDCPGIMTSPTYNVSQVGQDKVEVKATSDEPYWNCSLVDDEPDIKDAVKPIKKVPVEWVSEPLSEFTSKFRAAIVMINDADKLVECRININDSELLGWIPFEAFEKSKVPIKGGQQFYLYGQLSETKLVSWMEAYMPPMTPKKQKLLDEINKL